MPVFHPRNTGRISRTENSRVHTRLFFAITYISAALTDIDTVSNVADARKAKCKALECIFVLPVGAQFYCIRTSEISRSVTL